MQKCRVQTTRMHARTHARTHAHTHTPFTALLDSVWDYLGERAPEREKQCGLTGARDSEWQWHQLGHMQICTLIQTHNHASIPPLSFFTGWMPFLPSNQQHQSIEGTFFRLQWYGHVLRKEDNDSSPSHCLLFAVYAHKLQPALL